MSVEELQDLTFGQGGSLQRNNVLAVTILVGENRDAIEHSNVF